MGALMGKMGKSGVNDEFRKQVSDMMNRVLPRSSSWPRRSPRTSSPMAMKSYGGTLLKTSLTTEDEKELAHEALRQ